MKNNLITEVERIKEIMGVKSDLPLLTEGRNPWEEMIDFAVNLFKKERPALIRATDNYVDIGLVRLTKTVFNKLQTFLRTRSWDALSDIDARNLGAVLSQDINYVNRLYQEQFRQAMSRLRLSEEDLLKKISNDLGPNPNEQQVQSYLASIFRNPQDPSSFKPAETLAGTMASKIKNRIDEIKAGNFKEEIGSPEGLVKAVGKNVTPPILLAFRQIMGGGLFRSTKKLQQKLDDIVRRIDEKLAQTGGGGSLKKINREVRELFNVIVAMKKTADTDIRYLYDLHITNNPKIPDKVKEELEKEGYVKKIIEYMNEDLANSTLPIIRQKLQRQVESIPFFGGLFRSIAKAATDENYKFLNNIFREQWTSIKRLFNVILYKSPETLEDLVVNFSRTGTWATFVEKAAGYLLLHNAVIPFALATIEGMMTNSEIIKLREEVQALLELCADATLELNCPEEEIKLMKNYTDKQFIDSFLDKVPLLKPFRGEFHVDDLFFFTYLDEVIRFTYDAWHNYLYEDQDIFQKSLQRLKGLQNQYKEQLKLKGIDLDNMEAIRNFRELKNKTYDNSENGFLSLVKDWGQDTTGLKPKLPNGNYRYWDNEWKWVQQGPVPSMGKFEIVEQ